MNSLNILFFIFIFELMFLSSNGCYLRCRGQVFRQPPCSLFISIQRDNFFARAGGVLPFNVKQQLVVIQRQHSRRGSMMFRSGSFVQPTIDQVTARKICVAMRMACKYPTYIKFH